MALPEQLARYPREVPAGSARPEHRYRLRPDLFAVRGASPERFGEAIAELPDEEITIFESVPGGTAGVAPGALLPVYSLSAGGSPAVPTGEVLVRFAEGVDPRTHAPAIEQAGYRLEQVLSYAPHAAWVRARSSDTADALRHLAALAALPDVANVEPRMLSPVARR